MGRLFKGRTPPQAPQLPAQQAAPELMDVIDELSGVQTITVTGVDGKKRRVTQRLPLTPQEQQTLDQAKNLMNTAVNNIQRLYQYDPTTVVNYQPFIQAFSSINNERMRDLAQIGDFKDIAEKVEQFREISRDLTMKEFDERERMAEEGLARRGLSKSTQATELRAAMARERSLLAKQTDVDARKYGKDLQNSQLDTESRVYRLREEGRNSRLQEAETSYNLEQQRASDLENLRQNAINENANMLNVGQGITGQDTQRAQLALEGNKGAISMFGAQAHNQNQRHANEVNRIQGQHTMAMNQFRETPARFGQQIRDIALAQAGSAAGGYLTGGASATTPNRAPVERRI